MKKLAVQNRDALIELLRDRLASSRIAVALYDRTLERSNVQELPESGEVAEALSGLREQEQEHVLFLTERLLALGEATVAVPRRYLRGFEEVARSADARAAELVPALWALECAQDGAWDLLFRLARSAEDADAIAAFERRAREEHAHAVLLRDIVRSALRERPERDSARRAA